MHQLKDFFLRLFDYSDWPIKWHSGNWGTIHAWVYIISDLLIWSACFTLPFIIFRHLPKKNNSRSSRFAFLLSGVLCAAGITHFVDALSFWFPFYRFNTVMLLLTGLAGWALVFFTGKYFRAVFLPASQNTVQPAQKQDEQPISQENDSEIQLQTIYENAPDAIIVISSKGHIVKWNPAAEKMLGWKEEEVLGKVLNEVIVPEEYRQGYIAEVKNFLKTGTSEVFNRSSMLKVLRKNSSSLIVEFTVAPVKIKDDFLLIGFSRDATEKRKAEQALMESEERYRLLTSEVHDYSIIMLSPEGNISSWNEGAQRIKGYPENEILGKHFSVFYTENDVANNLPMEELAIAGTDGRCENEGWRVKKDGALFWANVVVTALKRNGRIIGFSQIMRDNTGRKKAEEQIRQLNASLEQRVIERTEELQQSEKKYRKLFENSPMPMWVLDLPSLNFIDVNQAAVNHYGYSRQEFLSMSALDIRPDDEKKRFFLFDHSPAHGMRDTGIWKHLKKDGSLIYSEVSSHEMNIDKKNARLVLSIDITERKIAEERLDFALEAGQIGIWELDLIHATSIRNLIHDQIYGYDEIIPDWNIQFFNSCVHPDDKAVVRETINEALHLQSWVIETRIVWPDSSVHWVLITGKTIRDNRDQPLKMLGTVIDITKIKHAEAEIQKLNTELEQRVQQRTRELYSANKELESFSYSVSHDLRAPLRAIHGYSKILLEDFKDKLDEEGNRLLNRVTFNAKKMERLIDDLLEFSRLSKTTLNKTSINLTKMVVDLAAELSHTGKNQKQKDITVGELGVAFADESTIRLVFQNLLLNAIKYSSKLENPVIEVGITETDRGDAYFVKDNGAGFDMAYYDKLFGVFQRFHRQEEFEGTGVGLAIVQKIILKHGGQVWAKSAINEGAIFYFTLR